MQHGIVFFVGCFVTEKISVCAAVKKSLIAFIRSFAKRERYGTIGKSIFYFRHNVAHYIICKKSVLTALQHKCAESEFVSVLATGEDFIFGKPITHGIAV